MTTTETDWKPGDVVRLKSGGPSMTLQSRGAMGAWIAKWFDSNNVLCEGLFHDAGLVRPISTPRT